MMGNRYEATQMRGRPMGSHVLGVEGPSLGC